jgi:hypothetical protein
MDAAARPPGYVAEAVVLAALGALLAAAVFAVAGWIVAPGAGEPAPVPAPPPATCRVAPSPGWAGYAEDPGSADLSPFQDYRAAMGIGTGVRGSGVTIADVEYEWRPGHVELGGLGLTAPPATGLPPGYRASDHGTAVLGVLGASPDGKGVSGLVPDADIRPYSPFATGSYDPAAAIAAAAQGLGPGDVLLVELQAIQDDTLIPIEGIRTVRQAIRDAVDRGIVVVEPAGNGGVDVGAIGIGWLAGQTAPGHSGALMVGAGGSDQDMNGSTNLRRVTGSNFGSRVDVQGVGVGVVTSGYGEGLGGADDRAYTACFDGTSSAAATVAGAVAALQSGAIAQRGAPLTPAQVRTLLVQTGLRQVSPGDGVIGPRPQVDAALLRLAGAPPPADPDLPSPTPESSPGAPVVPAAPAVRNAATATRSPAASTITARYARRGGRLTITLRGLVKGAKVTARGRAVKVVRGRVVLKRLKPGRIVVVVTPPARLRASFAPLRVVVVVAPSGRARVVRI